MIRFLLVILLVVAAWLSFEYAGGSNIHGQGVSATVGRLEAGLGVAVQMAKLNAEQTGSPERESPSDLTSHTAGAVLQSSSGASQKMPARVALESECEPSAVLPPDFVVEVHACTMNGSACEPAEPDQASLASAPRWLRLTYMEPAMCGTRGDYSKGSYKKYLLAELAARRLRKGAPPSDQVLAPDRSGLWLRIQ